MNVTINVSLKAHLVFLVTLLFTALERQQAGVFLPSCYFKSSCTHASFNKGNQRRLKVSPKYVYLPASDLFRTKYSDHFNSSRPHYVMHILLSVSASRGSFFGDIF